MKKLALSIVVSLLLAACASGRIGESEKLELYRANAGEPVSSFQFFGRLNGWTPLGDSAVAVWTKPREAFLLELSGSCPDLPFSQAISLTSNMNRVHARFDKVMALNRNSIRIPCHIREIRPLDVGAIREAERRIRDGDLELLEAAPEQEVQASGT